MKNTSTIQTDNLSEVPSVNITSLTFQHNPSDPTCSAITSRTVNTPTEPPEWKTGDSSVKPLLYVSTKIQKIDISINVSLLNTQNNTSVTLYLYNQDGSIFNGELSSTYSLVPGDNSITFSIPDPKIKNLTKITKYLSKLRFTFSCNGQIQSNEQNFLFELYVIPNVPVNPISLYQGNQDYYPIIDFINLFSIIESTQQGDPVQDIITQLHTNQLLKLKFQPIDNDMSKFSQIHHQLTPVDTTIKPLKTDVIQIDFVKFFRELERTSTYLLVDSEIYAVLLMYWFCLFGIEAVVSHIIPYSEDNLGVFNTKSLLAAGKTGLQPEFQLSSQAVVESGGLIYDASLAIPTQSGFELLAGLTFEKDEYNEQEGYVNKVFVDQTDAMPGGITNDISSNGMVCQITPVLDEELSC